MLIFHSRVPTILEQNRSKAGGGNRRTADGALTFSRLSPLVAIYTDVGGEGAVRAYPHKSFERAYDKATYFTKNVPASGRRPVL